MTLKMVYPNGKNDQKDKSFINCMIAKETIINQIKIIKRKLLHNKVKG